MNYFKWYHLVKKNIILIAKYCNRPNLIERLEHTNIPKFDINPYLKKLEYFNNETNETESFVALIKSKKFRLNHLTDDLREKWIDSNFSLTYEELIKNLTKEVLDSYVVSKKKKN